MEILVVDDDERILRLLSDYLKHNGFKVETATDGKFGLEKFKVGNFDLAILDVMMPIYDGWIVCKEIRKISEVPIIMLTAKDSDLDELFGFDIGVDDYVSKPFNITLLLARIKRLLKNNKSNSGLTYKEFEINREEHKVLLGGKEVELNPKEYELLLYFIENVNRVISREQLLSYIWGDDYFGDTRTVDTHINRLRNKLGEYSSYLKTVRGFGYKLGDD